ncbi:hypothetical protein RhiirA5_384012 [Rhizophagus irregularis]|uniref:CCHC-type domain-containing protein n=1 Tax=Rhizophagus irregularis TaxID=588596 RepID=A0A2N0NUS0_9GLOM|nr:hypothetical protein RhiirA5_384012 [Rhizophagus irregularis]
MSGNQNKTDKNDESSGSEQQFGGTESTTSVQDKAWNNAGCYVCERIGYIAKNCRQRNNQQNNNNRNNNGRDLRNVDCYNCGRKGHVSRNCRSPPSNNNNSNNGTNNGFQNNGRLNY